MDPDLDSGGPKTRGSGGSGSGFGSGSATLQSLQGKTQHWRGKLFVFDDRLVVPIRKPAHGEQKEEEEDVIRWDCGGGCRVRF
jgi:hypothetical protein